MTTLLAKQLRDKYMLGYKVVNIAKEFNVDRASVYRSIKGIDKSVVKLKVISAISNDYFTHKLNRDEICQKYGISQRTLYNYIKLHKFNKKETT